MHAFCKQHIPQKVDHVGIKIKIYVDLKKGLCHEMAWAFFVPDCLDTAFCF
jgi:hypothetical protein